MLQTTWSSHILSNIVRGGLWSSAPEIVVVEYVLVLPGLQEIVLVIVPLLRCCNGTLAAPTVPPPIPLPPLLLLPVPLNPKRIALPTLSVIACPISFVPSGSKRPWSLASIKSAVRQPSRSAQATPSSTAAASVSKPKECRSIIAVDNIEAMGLHVFWPAMSGAEPWQGSYIPGLPGSLRDADGNNPNEPDKTLASSVNISPNIFSVTTTSNFLGFVIKSMAVESTNPCDNVTWFVNSFSLQTSSATRRHKRDEANTLALSTLTSRPDLSIAARAATRTILSTSGVL